METEIKYTEVYAGRLKGKKYSGDDYDIITENFMDETTPSTKSQVFENATCLKMVFAGLQHLYDTCYIMLIQKGLQNVQFDSEQLLKLYVDKRLEDDELSYAMSIDDFEEQMKVVYAKNAILMDDWRQRTAKLNVRK